MGKASCSCFLQMCPDSVTGVGFPDRDIHLACSVEMESSLDPVAVFIGGAENDGHENDGPSKLQGMKLQDMKMQDMKLNCSA